MIKPVTDKEWADFGKKLYDSAISIFHDTPGVREVNVPFKTEDGFTAVAKFNESVRLLETEMRIEDGREVRYYRTIRPLSDGTYHKTEWSR